MLCCEDGGSEGRVTPTTTPFPTQEVLGADPGPLGGPPRLGGILIALSSHCRDPEISLGRMLNREGEELDPRVPEGGVMAARDTAVVHHSRI